MKFAPVMRPMIPGQWDSYDDEESSRSDSSLDAEDAEFSSIEHFRLLELPSELVDQVLSYLSPVALAKVCRTCKTLNKQANADRMWRNFLIECVPHDRLSHRPYESWKEMYGTHYPYWFLPKHKIWFSDKTALSNPLTGQLILARYDYRIGSIEGYRLRAEHPETDTFFTWTYDPSVVIHNFEPRVSMFLDDPIVKLDRDAFMQNKNRLQQEVTLSRSTMRTGDAIKSRIFPTVAIPEHWQAKSMPLWPPFTIPAPERVRNESPSLFQDRSHKPARIEEMSTTTFRIRKWLAFGGLSERLGLRTAEDVITYSTVMPEYYTPTADKPYQGLWVGDYAGHGVEFLIIIQSTPEEAQNLPPIVENPPRSIVDQLLPDVPETPHMDHLPTSQGCVGRLDAVKLTGDPNIPRGQASWIAEDISNAGLLRIAEEPEFAGARVVKSSGHIAAGGFRNDRYTPSQLIMISHDTLAQHWVEMGHISYFKRIDIDEYLRFPSNTVVDGTNYQED